MNDCLGSYDSHSPVCGQCLVRESCIKQTETKTEELKLYRFSDEGEDVFCFAYNEGDAFAFALNINDKLIFSESYCGYYSVAEGETFTI